MGREKSLESQVSVKTCTIATTCTFLCNENPSHLNHNPSLMEIPPNRFCKLCSLEGGWCSAVPVWGHWWWQLRLRAASAKAMFQRGHGAPGLLNTTQADACRLENDGVKILKVIMHLRLFSKGTGSWCWRKCLGLYSVLGCCANTKPDCATGLTAKVWGESQHKTQTDKQGETSRGVLLLWEWVTHTTDSWCCSNWTTFFYSQAG